NKHWPKPTFVSVTNTPLSRFGKRKNPCKHWFGTLARLYASISRSAGGEQPAGQVPRVPALLCDLRYPLLKNLELSRVWHELNRLIQSYPHFEASDLGTVDFQLYRPNSSEIGPTRPVSSKLD